MANGRGHDRTLMPADVIQRIARHIHDLVVVLGHQLEAAKCFAQLFELLEPRITVPTTLGKHLLRFVVHTL